MSEQTSSLLCSGDDAPTVLLSPLRRGLPASSHADFREDPDEQDDHHGDGVVGYHRHCEDQDS